MQPAIASLFAVISMRREISRSRTRITFENWWRSVALIDGLQLYQPTARNFDSTTNSDVIAYFYHANNEDVITVVNTGDVNYNGTLLLSSTETGNWLWLDLLHNTTVQSHARTLSVA